MTQPKPFEILKQIIETVNGTLDLEEVLSRIVELVCQVTTADACLLYLLDESSNTLVLRASKPIHQNGMGQIMLRMGEGLTGIVAQKHEPIVIERQAFEDSRFKVFAQLPEDSYEAFLSVPIVSHDQLVGVINVQHRSAHRYGRETIAVVEMIGRLVGGAIANARLYERIRQHQRELDTLAQVSEAVISTRYLDEILHLIVAVTAQLLGSEICSLMLLDEAKQVLTIKATQALSAAYREKPPIHVGQSVSGQAVKERRPISVLDVTQDSRYMFRDIAKQEGLCSMLSVPLMIKDRVIGVVNCYTTKPHRFTPDESRTLSTIASQVAVAIEHTELIDVAVRAREELQSRKVIEQAKGILMAQAGLSEQQAFRLLQRQSMEKRKSMARIAEAMVLADQLKADVKIPT